MNSTLPQILVVNDNPDDLNLLTKQLRHANYIVLESESVENCLKLLNQLTPDLIVLNVGMPGIDSLGICRRIRSIPLLSKIPLLVLTSPDEIEEKINGFVVDNVDFLVKPYYKQEVIVRIETHLKLKRKNMEVTELHRQLEEQMERRLVELKNEALWRRQYEQEVAKLLEIVRYQGEQLRTLMQYCMSSNNMDLRSVAKIVTALPRAYFNLLREHIDLAHVHFETNRNGAAPDEAATILVAEHLSASSELLNTIEDSLEYAAAQQFKGLYEELPTTTILAKLSAREREILQLIADGNSNAETAQLLTLAEPTIRVYRSRIMGKLQLEDTTALIKFAIKHNLTAVQ